MNCRLQDWTSCSSSTEGQPIEMLSRLLGTYSETSPQVELLGPDLLTACATTKPFFFFCLYQDLLQR